MLPSRADWVMAARALLFACELAALSLGVFMVVVVLRRWPPSWQWLAYVAMWLAATGVLLAARPPAHVRIGLYCVAWLLLAQGLPLLYAMARAHAPAAAERYYIDMMLGDLAGVVLACPLALGLLLRAAIVLAGKARLGPADVTQSLGAQ